MPRKKRPPVVAPDPDPEFWPDQKLEPAEEEPESVTHTRERLKQLQEESAKQAELQAALDARQEEDQARRDKAVAEAEVKNLEHHASLVEHGGSRDQLLDRIREMREEKPKPIEPMGLTEGMRQQLTAEQEAGRAAVARAQEAADAARKNREVAVADQLAREGRMEEVRHPNPGQNEQFPAEKATLGKKK